MMHPVRRACPGDMETQSGVLQEGCTGPQHPSVVITATNGPFTEVSPRCARLVCSLRAGRSISSPGREVARITVTHGNLVSKAGRDTALWVSELVIPGADLRRLLRSGIRHDCPQWQCDCDEDTEILALGR